MQQAQLYKESKEHQEARDLPKVTASDGQDTGQKGALEATSSQPPLGTDRRLSLAQEGSDSGHASRLQQSERTPGLVPARQAPLPGEEAQLRGQPGPSLPSSLHPQASRSPKRQEEAAAGTPSPGSKSQFGEDRGPPCLPVPRVRPPGVGAQGSSRRLPNGVVRFPRQRGQPSPGATSSSPPLPLLPASGS